MKVYVAAKFEQAQTARAAMDLLEAEGHEITHDWTGEHEGGRTGYELKEFLGVCAQADLEGVRHADAILVLHHDALCGGLVEFGVALADPDKLILVAGSHEAKRRPIFYELPRVCHFRSVVAAVRALTDAERARVFTRVA